MSECVHIGCDRPQRARRLCEAHYAKLKRSGLGPVQRKQPEKPTGLKAMAQAGLNRSCVDCRAKPWAGGMRCWPCFKGRVAERADSVRRFGLNVWDEQ
jgi:hypothetical protein